VSVDIPPLHDLREPNRLTIPGRIALALRRARFGILTMGLAYGIGVTIGVVMVHSDNSFALNYRDKIVSNAQKSSPILKQLDQGQPMRAAALDCAGNLTGASATALAGYWAPGPFPIALYRGWIGGIVSVNGKHRSRLSRFASGFYYVCTILLQLLPYSLLGGAGVNLGLARAKPVGVYAGPRFLGLPKEALRDAGWIFALCVPLFAVASAFEFLW
jgi:hypothetical protein